MIKNTITGAVPFLLAMSMIGSVSAMTADAGMMTSTAMMSDTVSLQTFLEAKGFLTMPNGTSKGHFGPITKRALIKFQQSVGLNAMGYYGPMTRAKVQESMSMNQSTTVPAATVDTSVGVMVGGAMMTPNLDIVDNAVHANNVTTVVTAVKAAGLVDTLKGAGPFTVFAPTNDAFAKLPTGTVATLLLPENKAKLVDILTYHVVAGSYRMADLTNGLTLKTVEGRSLTFTRVNGVLMINGSAMIDTPDVISRNGVTHVINSVLMPQ